MDKITPKDDIGIDPSFFTTHNTVFLAGSMGSNWREQLIEAFKDSDLIFIDPSVEDWENEVGEESFDNPKYVRQVTWEQYWLKNSNIAIFHFDETSLAPISLFEFGTSIGNNIIVYLEGDYKKAGYIKITGVLNDIPIANSLKELTTMLNIFQHIRKFR